MFGKVIGNAFIVWYEQLNSNILEVISEEFSKISLREERLQKFVI